MGRVSTIIRSTDHLSVTRSASSIRGGPRHEFAALIERSLSIGLRLALP
jgi:hypothetical protein